MFASVSAVAARPRFGRVCVDVVHDERGHMHSFFLCIEAAVEAAAVLHAHVHTQSIHIFFARVERSALQTTSPPHVSGSIANE